MASQVVVLNGGSSSGKSTIARALQDILPTTWLTFGVDDLVDALPPAGGDIVVHPDGSVDVGPGFSAAESAWMHGIAEIARAGAPVIVDDVFLGGAASQERWRTALAGLGVLWVGVRCDPDTAAAREASRGDRTAGMARSQAVGVHDGVRYDVVVDSAADAPDTCARTIAQALARSDSVA
ncbi:MAG: AAA family ATPase [Acidothermales bacterium]|nr:AAA family ATPase [Acidothermales bacterium]